MKAQAVARRRDGYTHDVEIDERLTLVIDEPREKGGNDQGPTPTRALAGALAACTAITVEMYAARKEWELGAVEVTVDMEYDEKSTIHALDVTLCVPEQLDEEQQRRLLVIAGKCPVHRALTGQTPVKVTDSIVCG
jgi:putative redox protein